MEFANSQIIDIDNRSSTIEIASLGYFDAFDKGRKNFELADYRLANKHFSEALVIATECNRGDLKLECNDRISYCHFHLGEFDQMLGFATESLALSEKFANDDLKVIALNRIGIAYGSFGINEEALNYFLEAVKLAEDTNHQDLPIIYNNISVIYYHLGHVEGSLPYLEKALKLAEETNQDKHKLTCLLNFGERYAELGKFKESIESLQIALELARKTPTIQIVKIYQHVGDCLSEQGKFELAVKSYHKALFELRQWDSDHVKSNLLFNLASVFVKQRKYSQALPHLHNALSSAEVSTNLKVKFDTHKTLSDIYKQMGEFEQALQHFEDFHNTREQVHDQDAQKRLLGMMVKYDVDSVQKEKELAEKEQELAELKYVELAQLHERLEEQSRLDALTQICNRGYLDDFLANEYMKAVRLSRSISVMMCDVDYFKKINDGHSHAVGDDVLRTLAKLLKENLRKDDLVARYGGEEFVVVFPQTQFEQAVKVAEKLRKIVETYPWEKVARGLNVTISAGVASGTDYESYEKLLARADLKLYEAKDAGRNQIKH